MLPVFLSEVLPGFLPAFLSAFLSGVLPVEIEPLTARKRPAGGVVAGVVAGRPLLIASIIAMGVMALAAHGARTGASVPGGAGPTLIMLAGLLTALGLGGLAPAAMSGRLVYAASLLIGVIGVIALSATDFLPQLARWSVIVACGLFTAALLVISQPLWRPEVRLAVPLALSAALGLAGGSYLASLLGDQLALSPPLTPPLTPLMQSAVLFGMIGAIAVSAAIAGRAVSIFATGGDMRAAIARTLARRGGLFFFVWILLLALILLIAMPEGATREHIAAGIGLYCLTMAIALLPAIGAMALAQRDDRLTDFVNFRAAEMRKVLRRLRPFLPASTCLAASAIVAIVCLVVLFDAPQMVSADLFIVAGMSAAIASLSFVSIRTGLLIGALALMAGLSGSAILGLTGDPFSGAALALSLLAAGPLASEWRESRAIRANSWQVAEEAMLGGFPAYCLTLVLAGLALFLAGAGDMTPGMGLVRPFVIQSALTTVLVLPVMIAYGALLGKE